MSLSLSAIDVLRPVLTLLVAPGMFFATVLSVPIVPVAYGFRIAPRLARAAVVVAATAAGLVYLALNQDGPAHAAMIAEIVFLPAFVLSFHAVDRRWTRASGSGSVTDGLGTELAVVATVCTLSAATLLGLVIGAATREAPSPDIGAFLTIVVAAVLVNSYVLVRLLEERQPEPVQPSTRGLR